MTTRPGPDVGRADPAGRDPGARAPGPTHLGQTRHHPVVVAHERALAEDLQMRLADGITRFAGSMPFVYAHVAGFALWMLLVEDGPWPTLTLVVSLEAIFLSTFVMIGQNRQARFQQLKADHDFVAQEQDLQANTDMTLVVETLVRDIHRTVHEQPTPWRPL